ncbi:MAG TPA: cytochrome c [Verrucomicrobiae bacterium]|nr:cytochrome c [Verrucomicrobiae bacterium]
MKTKWIWIGSLTAILSTSMIAQMAMAQTHPARAPHPYKQFMEKKLVYQDKILQGIVLEDYQQIETNSVKLWVMSKDNMFAKLQNKEFQAKVDAFQKATTSLYDAAQSKDTTNVLKAYEKLTRTCVDCHSNFRHQQFMRDILDASQGQKRNNDTPFSHR